MRSTIGGVVLGSIGLVVFGVAGSAQAPSKPDGSTIDPCALTELNDRIQQRFKDINAGFGFARIIKPGTTPHTFEPENVAEMDAVRGLESARLQVFLYLAGRRVLSSTSLQEFAYGWGPVKGPVLITASDSAGAPLKGMMSNGSAPPPPQVLVSEARLAILDFAKSASREFDIPTRAGWRFVAYPVRAVDSTCLNCHRERSATRMPVAEGVDSLRVGDALGTIMYAYRQRP